MTFNSDIQDKLSYWFQENLGLRDYRRGWLKGDCPYCGKHDKFGINIEQNRSNCFFCGNHGGLLKVLVDINEDVSTFRQALAIINATSGNNAKFKTKKVEVKSEVKEVSLPEEFKLLSFGNNQIAKYARSYMRKRGYNITSLTLKGIGYCDSGEYRGCIIIPYYEQGKLIYFTGRRFINLFGEEKFKNPKEEDIGVGKSIIIYNIDALNIYNKVRIVESATNALTLPDNVIALSGKAISSHQLSDIIRSPVKNLSLLLDPDAEKETYKLAIKLSEHKKTKVTILPQDTDVNSLGRKKTLIFEKQSKYQGPDYYRKKLINI